MEQLTYIFASSVKRLAGSCGLCKLLLKAVFRDNGLRAPLKQFSVFEDLLRERITFQEINFSTGNNI